MSSFLLEDKVPSLHMEKNSLDSEFGFCWYRSGGASFLCVDFEFFPGHLDREIRLSVCVCLCVCVFSHCQSLLLQAIDKAKRKPRELTTVSLVPWFCSQSAFSPSFSLLMFVFYIMFTDFS